MSKYVYSFGGGKADGDGTMKDMLGGKGAGLAEMSRAGLPVPPGFTISTDVCNIYFSERQQSSGRRSRRRSTRPRGSWRSRWGRSWAMRRIRCW